MKTLRRDTVSEENYSILDYGWDERLEGKRLTDNPYAVNNWKYYEWKKGWEMADRTPGNMPDSTPDNSSDLAD